MLVSLHADSTVTLLVICVVLLLWILEERDATNRAVDEYRAEGRRIEDLYSVASAEERSLVSPAASVLFALVLCFGIAGLWSAGRAMSSAHSRPGVIGIGGGR